jgi:hypothetical protein
MDKYTGFFQDSAGNLNVAGTAQVRVTSALSDTLVPIYSSDSLLATKANPFTLPSSGKIEFHARNGKVRVKVINGAVETPIDEVAMNAGVTFGTFAARPAAGSADRVYVATDTGRIYYDNGTTWADTPDFALTTLPIEALENAAHSGGHSMLNGTLVASVGSNALTVAVKTLAGTDPSATDPVYVLTRSATAALGTFDVLKLTAALSLTISSGSLVGTVNSIPFRLWAVIFNDGGTARLGLINCLATSAGVGAGHPRIADSIYPLAQFGIASSTAEGGAGGADSAQVFYTSAAVASKGYTVVGYCTYETGLATAGTWSAVPTRLELFRRGTPLPGHILQRVRTAVGAVATGATTIPFDDTAPQATEGDQYMSLAITPSSAANVLAVEAQAWLTNSAAVTETAALWQDAQTPALVAVSQAVTTGGNVGLLALAHAVLATITAATTFKLRAGGSAAGTTTFNGTGGARRMGGLANSYMAADEVMA